MLLFVLALCTDGLYGGQAQQSALEGAGTAGGNQHQGVLLPVRETEGRTREEGEETVADREGTGREESSSQAARVSVNYLSSFIPLLVGLGYVYQSNCICYAYVRMYVLRVCLIVACL